MQRQSRIAISTKSVDSRIIPDICSIAAMLAQFHIVDMRRRALFEYRDQLVF